MTTRTRLVRSRDPTATKTDGRVRVDATAELVTLVDADDRPIGTAEKLAAHREGLLHRAISVFVVDGRGRLLLQRRALGKYHSVGLWSNSCCSHPRPGEPVLDAAHRRLREEMGFDCELEAHGCFTYRAELTRDLVEHEIDHLFVGQWNGTPMPDPEQVGEWRWLAPASLASELRDRPERFTAWFALALAHIADKLPTP